MMSWCLLSAADVAPWRYGHYCLGPCQRFANAGVVRACTCLTRPDLTGAYSWRSSLPRILSTSCTLPSSRPAAPARSSMVMCVTTRGAFSRM